MRLSPNRLVLASLLLAGLTAGAQEPTSDADAGEELWIDAGEPAAPAQEAEPSTPLDQGSLEGLLSEPVLSSASKTAESASEAPATTWTISGTDLKRYGIQSVEEAIRYLGHGMTSYEYDNRQNAAFGARGFMSDNLGLHFAVLIDGNQAGGSSKTARGAQPYLMPIELVDHLEIVIGPGSVLYGNSAMLGVVNVITRAASSLEGTQGFVQVSGGLPVDKWAKDITWGEAWVRAGLFGSKTWQLGGKPFELAWHLAVRWDRQQGRSVWHGVEGVDPFERPAEAFGREDVFNRDLGGRLFGRANWGNWRFLAWGALTSGSGTGPITGTGASSYTEPEYGLDAMWARQLGDRGDFSVRAYAVVFDSKIRTGAWPPDPQNCLRLVGSPSCSDTVRYLAVKPYLESLFSWDWNQDGSQVTTFGVQAFMEGSFITTGVEANDGSNQRLDAPIDAPVPNGALFVQHIWRGRFGNLNLGLRGDLGFLGSAVSPRVAYSVSPWDNGTLKLIFSTAFRTPTITERYLEIEGFLTSNPSIAPERVYSAEVDLAQRFGLQNLQLAVFGTYWEGMITTHSINVNGVRLSQFANLRNVWSAGVNLAIHGASGRFDWALSANYAPGRLQLPGGIAQSTDQQLSDMRLTRAALDRYGSAAFGSVFLPNDGMPDFYAIGHLSFSLGAQLPRLSIAAHLNSPVAQTSWASNLYALDPRYTGESLFLPWSIDARAAVESDSTGPVGWRLVVTGRSLQTAPTINRVGDSHGPVPGGGLGVMFNPVARLSAMAEINVRL